MSTFYGHTKRNLIDYLGADKPLRDVTPGIADEFRLWLLRPKSLDGKGGEGLVEGEGLDGLGGEEGGVDVGEAVGGGSA